jgi:sulfatase maturation enzyme AslB (radical SAM superfamily)
MVGMGFKWMANKINKTVEEIKQLANGDAFCILPWIHMHPWPDGRVFTCCLTNQDNVVGNLNDNTLEEVYNSDAMKSIRQDMLNNKKVSNCNRCYELEQVGHDTLRKTSNAEFVMEKYNLHEDKSPIVVKTNEDGSLDDVHLTYMDIRFSNICNMRCRTCGPDLSSQWYEDAVDSKFNRTPTQKILQIRKGNTAFMEQFDPYLHTVEKIYWAGGEPLIMDEHWYIMNRLVELGKTDVRMFYNTNFSTLTYKDQDAIELWKNFKHVSIGASLDAGWERGEYLRKGTIWNNTLANRERMKSELPQHDFNISCTVSMFNVLDVCNFYKRLCDIEFIDPKDFGVNILLGKEVHRATVLPEHMRQQAKDTILETLEWLKGKDPVGRATSTFNSLLQFLDGDDTHLLSSSLQEAKEMDRFRSETLFDTFPELEELRPYYDEDCNE